MGLPNHPRLAHEVTARHRVPSGRCRGLAGDVPQGPDHAVGDRAARRDDMAGPTSGRFKEPEARSEAGAGSFNQHLDDRAERVFLGVASQLAIPEMVHLVIGAAALIDDSDCPFEFRNAIECLRIIS